jgi:hypothetical protein
MSTIHSDAASSEGRIAPPARGLGRVAVLAFAVVALLVRIFRRSGKAAPARTFGGMSHDEFAKFAGENPPPQKWFDEDLRGLRGAAR